MYYFIAAHLQGGPKIGTLFVRLIASSNIDSMSESGENL